jgi:acyl-CoA thioesterase
MSGIFAEDIVVEPAGGEGRYRAFLDHSWDLFPNPQGGIIASFGLRAAQAEIADPRQKLRTCTCVFAGQVAAGELEIEVTVLRHGRSASQIITSVKNVGEEAGTTVMAVFGAPRMGPTFVDVEPPEVRAPLECRSWSDPPPPGVEVFEPAPFWTRVESRAAIGHAPWEEYEVTTSDDAQWMRYVDPPIGEDGAIDPLGVMTLADRMPGAVFEKIGRGKERWFAPSADLTVHFFEPARTHWILAHNKAHWADDGWASAQSTLWSEDGTLLLYATQMMLFTQLRQ